MKVLFIIFLVFFIISFMLRSPALMVIFGVLMILTTIGQAIVEICKRIMGKEKMKGGERNNK